MSWRLLLDQGLPRSAGDHLRPHGLDVVHTGDIGLWATADEEILQHALAEDRIVVTLDADFHRLMVLSGATQPSVIRIRIQGLRGEELAQLLLDVLRLCPDELAEGSPVSVQEDGLRLRRLPIARLSPGDPT
jgi:predicted nuclease of predicted toxin-antitoxin system